MRLIIVRHGKAERDSPSGRDADRALRGRGRRQAAYLGDQLASGWLRPDMVLTSGHVRAKQTAEIIVEIAECELRHEPLLELGHDPGAVVGMLELLGDVGTVAIVGHNPQLSVLVGDLASPGEVGGEAALRTGEAAVLDFDGPVTLRAGRVVERLRASD